MKIRSKFILNGYDLKGIDWGTIASYGTVGYFIPDDNIIDIAKNIIVASLVVNRFLKEV